MYTIDEIKKILKNAKITQIQLSEKANISINTLRGIFSHKVKNPRIDTMLAICNALNISTKMPNEYYDEVNIEGQTLVPLLGSVVAGVPIEAQQNIEEYIWISQRPANMYFALRVHGDSMMDAGIQDKSVLIVRKQDYADNGDIIVAMLNGAQTVKRFKIFGNTIFLMPENNKYDPIPVLEKDELIILGRVVEVRLSLL